MFDFEVTEDVMFLRCENFDSFSNENGKNGRFSTAVTLNRYFELAFVTSSTCFNYWFGFEEFSLIDKLLVGIVGYSLIINDVDVSGNETNSLVSLFY